MDCSCGACLDAMSHKQMMKRLERTKFCPVLAGDLQSSRRLTEVVLAGCIPLFVGPPFHTLPLVTEIDYLSFSVRLTPGALPRGVPEGVSPGPVCCEQAGSGGRGQHIGAIPRGRLVLCLSAAYVQWTSQCPTQ